MIELKNVSKFYHANGVTNVGILNVNLKLNKGEIVAITGESGSGKSTLLNVISKIDSFDEGEIYYKGNETSYFTLSDMDDFRKNKVGFIFQNYNILDSYTVLENVMLPLLLKGIKKEDARKQAMDLIEKVGLKGREYHRGTKLSGGEKQRCVIARALASDCEILACDEPTGNLDSETAKEIIQLIVNVASDKLVLIVTHNYPEIDGIATRQLRVADGKIVEDIVYKEVDAEENEKLDLDYKPLPKKTTFQIAYHNIVSTPKKSILVGVIFFVISFIFLFLIQIINAGIGSVELYTTSDYPNNFENFLMVYDDTCKEIETDDLSDYNATINNFAGTITSAISINNTYFEVYYAENIPNYHLIAGDFPSNEKEFLLVISSSDTATRKAANDYIGKKLEFFNLEGFPSDFVVSGIATHSETTSQTYYNHYVVTGCEKLEQVLNIYAVVSNNQLNIQFESTEFDKITWNLSVVFGDNEPTLYLPNAYQNKVTYDVSLAGYDYNNIKVEYADISQPTLTVSYESDWTLKPYFATIEAASARKAKSIKKSLTKLGYAVDYPNGESDTSSVVYIIMKIVAGISSMQIALYLIGIFFITYVILSKIYASRSKDYEILRVLGVTKKDMRHIVNDEILFLGGCVILLSFILNIILYNAVPALQVYSKFELGTILFYFIIMFLFTYLMALRFNKRLFKFSVRRSMKGVEEDD